MNILLPYFSRTGHTEAVALVLAEEMRRRGHAVTVEKIEPVRRSSKWRLVPPLWSALPLLPLYLWVPPFRRWWWRRYPQAELPIRPLRHPDVAAFDLICLGGPKWLYIAYPVARWLAEVSGLEDKPVAAFASFCGPPLKVFEMEMLFEPLNHRITGRGGRLIARLAVSSHYHEFFFRNEMEWVFRLVSRLAFRRPLREFTLGSGWGRAQVAAYCDGIDAAGKQTSKARSTEITEKSWSYRSL